MGVACNDSDCLEIARLANCNRRGSVEYKLLLDILRMKTDSLADKAKRPGSAKYLPLNSSRKIDRSKSTEYMAATLHAKIARTACK